MKIENKKYCSVGRLRKNILWCRKIEPHNFFHAIILLTDLIFSTHNFLHTCLVFFQESQAGCTMPARHLVAFVDQKETLLQLLSILWIHTSSSNKKLSRLEQAQALGHKNPPSPQARGNIWNSPLLCSTTAGLLQVIFHSFFCSKTGFLILNPMWKGILTTVLLASVFLWEYLRFKRIT